MVQPAFLHILNLDTIGGVETLYVQFLRELLTTHAELKAHHHTIVAGKRTHDKYLPVFSSLGLKRPFQEQYVMGMRLPKFLRFFVEIRRGMVESLFDDICRWVFWNRIEESRPQAEYIYYEHGASWMTKHTKKREEFLHSSKKIIANSKAAQIIVANLWNIPYERIVIVKNPLRSDIALATTPKKLTNGRPIKLGYIGRLVALKAPSTCLFTAKTLIDRGVSVTLDIAGEGPEKEFLRDTAKKLGISHNVRFLGTIDNISSFYDSLDFLLIPSIREPLGLVALEASSRGVPVIASCVDGLYESVLDDVSGILIKPSLDISTHGPAFLSKERSLPDMVVDPRTESLTQPKLLSPEEVTSSVIHLLNDPQKYENLSRGGIEHVRSTYSFKEYTERLLAELLDPPYELKSDV